MTISFTELYFDRGNFYDFTSLGEFLVHDMPIAPTLDVCNVWSCDLFFYDRVLQFLGTGG